MNLAPISKGLDAAFGEIWGYETDTTIAIGGTGIANKVQITAFNHDGYYKDTTPDHTNDHITIDKEGLYVVNVSLSILSSGAGGADEIGFGVFKNNGAVQFQGMHTNRVLAGGGGDSGSVSLSGMALLEETDTIEVWLWNYDSTDDVVIDDINLSVFQISKTTNIGVVTGNPIGLLLVLTYS